MKPAKIGILLLLVTATGVSEAARYKALPLTVNQAIAVNNKAHILATSATDQPAVYLPTKTNDEIDGFNETPLDVTNLTATALSVVATDISDFDNESESEIISGWYEEFDGSFNAVVWERQPGGNYDAIKLPNFEYRQILCLTGERASRNAPNCFDESDRDSLIAASNCANPTPFFDPADPTDITVIATDCDFQAKALGVNNDGLIIGESITPAGERRAIYWSRSGEIDEVTGKATYFAYDLGYQTITDTSTDPATQSLLRRKGTTSFISKSANLIVGNIIPVSSSILAEPMVWPELNATGEYPEPLTIPRDKDGLLSFLQNDTGSARKVTVTSYTGSRLAGWFEDEAGDTYAIVWSIGLDQRTESWNITDVSYGLERLEAGESSLTLNPTGKGKILDRNARNEFVGASYDTPGVKTDNGYNAFISSVDCGNQNLNELLDTDQSDTLWLESAHSAAIQRTDQNAIESYVLAEGRNLTNGTLSNYALVNANVNIDLSVSLRSDHDSLVVGQQHTYNLVVKNESSTNNYATCLKVRLAAYVPIREKTEDEYQFAISNQDPYDDDRLVYKEGGLTFLTAKASGSTFCSLGHIEVSCLISRLDPGAEVSIEVVTEPRGLLADRTVRTEATVSATESEADVTNNKAITLTDVKREGCFIATAAYGSYFEPQVKVLRDFRDDFLSASPAGRWLIKQYYTYSPTAAQWLNEHAEWKPLVRGVLTPVVWSVKTPWLTFFSLAAFFTGFFYLGRRRNGAI